MARNLSGGGRAVSSPPVLDMTGICKQFGTAKILNGVSLSLAAGEVVVILGRSGSGKSTLLRCIAGLEQIDAGEISLLGQAMDKPRDVHGKVGFVFQHFNLFPHLTALGNVALALRWVKKLDRRAAD